MNNLKVYLDHFYFSLFVVLLGMLVFYMLASTVGSDPAVTTNQGSISYTAKIAVGAWILISAVLAGALTVRTIRNRPVDHTVYTKREGYYSGSSDE